MELFLLILTGAGHILVETLWGGATEGASAGTPERLYNLVAICLWAAYLLARIVKRPSLLTEWGMRREGFKESMLLSSKFWLPACIFLLMFGAYTRQLPSPKTAWVALLLYPLYGLVQQFALQVLVTTNLRPRVQNLWGRSILSGLLFSAAHIPTLPLVLLTFPVGVALTWTYERHRNLWALGLVHGLLGALAYYTVLGLDPGAEILSFVKMNL